MQTLPSPKYPKCLLIGVAAELPQICTWIDSPQTFEEASAAAAERFKTVYTESFKNWENLTEKMVQGDFG